MPNAFGLRAWGIKYNHNFRARQSHPRSGWAFGGNRKNAHALRAWGLRKGSFGMAGKPWEQWYHVMGNTYGTWVYGDPKGWHTRHHREHVEGDYKSPPPEGVYREKFARSKALMTRPAVILTREQRVLACRVMGEGLVFYNAEVAALCVGAKHFHLLARFVNCEIERPRPSAEGPSHTTKPTTPGGRGRSKVHAFDIDPKPRLVVGRVKSWTTKKLKEAGHFAEHKGGLWGKRPQVVPVENEGHFIFLRDRYIPGHRDEGAAVWGALGE